MKKTHIIVHHSLVSYDKNPSQFEAIERYHAAKGWGSGTGYNFVIEKDGVVENGRSLETAGAHCYQENMNQVGIGICLSGNFDIEEPTKEQCKSLLQLIHDLQKAHGIKDENVLPHRHFAKYKSCWGELVPDNILNYLERRTNDHLQEQIQDNEAILKQKLDKAWKEIDEANAVVKYIAQLKGVTPPVYKIISGK